MATAEAKLGSDQAARRWHGFDSGYYYEILSNTDEDNDTSDDPCPRIPPKKKPRLNDESGSGIKPTSRTASNTSTTRNETSTMKIRSRQPVQAIYISSDEDEDEAHVARAKPPLTEKRSSSSFVRMRGLNPPGIHHSSRRPRLGSSTDIRRLDNAIGSLSRKSPLFPTTRSLHYHTPLERPAGYKDRSHADRNHFITSRHDKHNEKLKVQAPDLRKDTGTGEVISANDVAGAASPVEEDQSLKISKIYDKQGSDCDSDEESLEAALAAKAIGITLPAQGLYNGESDPSVTPKPHYTIQAELTAKDSSATLFLEPVNSQALSDNDELHTELGPQQMPGPMEDFLAAAQTNETNMVEPISQTTNFFNQGFRSPKSSPPENDLTPADHNSESSGPVCDLQFTPDVPIDLVDVSRKHTIETPIMQDDSSPPANLTVLRDPGEADAFREHDEHLEQEEQVEDCRMPGQVSGCDENINRSRKAPFESRPQQSSFKNQGSKPKQQSILKDLEHHVANAEATKARREKNLMETRQRTTMLQQDLHSTDPCVAGAGNDSRRPPAALFPTVLPRGTVIWTAQDKTSVETSNAARERRPEAQHRRVRHAPGVRGLVSRTTQPMATLPVSRSPGNLAYDELSYDEFRKRRSHVFAKVGQESAADLMPSAELPAPKVASVRRHRPTRRSVSDRLPHVPESRVTPMKITQDDIIMLLLRCRGANWDEVSRSLRHRTGTEKAAEELQEHCKLLRASYMDGELPKSDTFKDICAATAHESVNSLSWTTSSNSQFGLQNTNPDRTDRPTTGGKTINAEAYAAMFEDLEESDVDIDDEATEAKQAEPESDLEDKCYFCYYIDRKVCTPSEDEDLIDWQRCKGSFFTLESANNAAAKEFLNDRGCSHIWPLTTYQMYFDDEHLVHWSGSSENGSLYVRVTRALRVSHAASRPVPKNDWMRRPVFAVMRTETLYEPVAVEQVQSSDWSSNTAGSVESQLDDDVGLFTEDPRDQRNTADYDEDAKREHRGDFAVDKGDLVQSTLPPSNNISPQAMTAARTVESPSASGPPQPCDVAETLERGRVISTVTSVKEFAITVRDMANRRAGSAFLREKRASEAQNHRGQKRARIDEVEAERRAEEREMNELLDQLEESKEAFDDTVEAPNSVIRIWVESGLLIGPRNI